jgi:hypothetical protein
VSDELPEPVHEPGIFDGFLGLVLHAALSNWVHGEELQEGEAEVFAELGWLNLHEHAEPSLTRAGERIVAAFLTKERKGRRGCWTGGDGPEGHEPGKGSEGRAKRAGWPSS